jgi:hypothetical protein
MLSNEGNNNDKPRQENKLTGEKEAASSGKARKSNDITKTPIRARPRPPHLTRRKQARGNRARPNISGRGGRKGY